MKPPAANHSSEDLATSVQREKKPTPVSVPLNPAAPEWVKKSSESKITDPDRDIPSSEGSFKQLFQQQQQLIQLQQHTFQSTASTIRQGFALPKPELNKLNGNPLEFFSFIRSFDNNIEKNSTDEGEKMTFLLQYCTGAARDAIKSCVTMDPALGYQEARKLLKDRFDHPFKIATAHLNQVTRGPPVKPNDQKGLLAFADQLKDCQNVLDSIGYLDEINSADNLRSIIDRLPFHLKTKWLEVADSIRESGQRPRIHHISRVRGNQPGGVVETYALLDSGSDVSLCDKKLIHELGISDVPRNFFLTTQEKMESSKSGLEVKLTIDSINSQSSLEIPKVWTVDRLNISEQSIPRGQDADQWPHLSDIYLPEIDSNEVRLIIGCNVPDAFWVLEERRGGKGDPVAIRSILGWTIIVT
ncbi:hypothetical protein ACROYT_G040106 [Oculina patagonica]